MTIIAGGGPAASRSAMFGAAMGQGLGAVGGQMLGQRHAAQREQKQLDPFRQAFLSGMEGLENLTPAQQMMQAAASDPGAFSRLFAEQGAAGLAGMMQPAQPAAPIKARPGDVFLDPNTLEPRAAIPERQEPGTFSRVVNWDSPLNERFSLGLQEGQSARVEFAEDPETGAITGSVASFRGGPETVINLGDSAESHFAKELAKLQAERISGIRENAENARRRLAPLGQLRASLPVDEQGKPLQERFETGALGNVRLQLSQLAEFVGVSPETIPLLGSAETAESLEAASQQLAVEVARELGRVTNMTLRMAENTVPHLQRTPEGNRIILDVMERAANLDIQRADEVNRFLSKHGSFRAPDGTTVDQMIFEFDEANKVVDAAMERRIHNAMSRAPSSFTEVLEDPAEAINRRAGNGGPSALPRFPGEVRRMSEADVETLVQRMDEQQWNRLRPDVREEIMNRLNLQAPQQQAPQASAAQQPAPQAPPARRGETAQTAPQLQDVQGMTLEQVEEMVLGMDEAGWNSLPPDVQNEISRKLIEGE